MLWPSYGSWFSENPFSGEEKDQMIAPWCYWLSSYSRQQRTAGTCGAEQGLQEIGVPHWSG